MQGASICDAFSGSGATGTAAAAGDNPTCGMLLGTASRRWAGRNTVMHAASIPVAHLCLHHLILDHGRCHDLRHEATRVRSRKASQRAR